MNPKHLRLSAEESELREREHGSTFADGHAAKSPDDVTHLSPASRSAFRGTSQLEKSLNSARNLQLVLGTPTGVAGKPMPPLKPPKLDMPPITTTSNTTGSDSPDASDAKKSGKSSESEESKNNDSNSNTGNETDTAVYVVTAKNQTAEDEKNQKDNTDSGATDGATENDQKKEAKIGNTTEVLDPATNATDELGTNEIDPVGIPIANNTGKDPTNETDQEDIDRFKEMFGSVMPDDDEVVKEIKAEAANHTTTFDDDFFVKQKQKRQNETKQEPSHHVKPPPKTPNTPNTPDIPASHHPSAKPPSSTTQVQCNGSGSKMDYFLCSAAIQIDRHPIPFMLLMSTLIAFCCWRFCCRQGTDRRGEYRAVAAQYTGNAYDDTFNDNYSQNGDDMSDGGFEDEPDDAWSTGKHSIEMSTLGDEENGGLTLEEMNG